MYAIFVGNTGVWLRQYFEANKIILDERPEEELIDANVDKVLVYSKDAK